MDDQKPENTNTNEHPETPAPEQNNATPDTPTTGNDESLAYGIAVNGNDVIVTGDTYNQSAGTATAKYWINGSVVNLSSGNTYETTNRVFLK